MNAQPVHLLISRDLFFQSKVTSTAAAVGSRVLVAATESEALRLGAEHRPAAIHIDLNAGAAATEQAIQAYRAALGDQTKLIAFGSHVDREALDRARAAGCDEVMPRSKFSADLPRILSES